MTFLNPLYLIALAAASIPIILHLLNLRKSRVIEFSTLAFLKELQRSKIRKLKLRQWLLLALRTLIIIFVVLAFTRPALRSSFGFLPGTAARSSVVIILDNSLSTLVSDTHGQVIKQARQKAHDIVNLLEAGDEAVLLRTSDASMGSAAFTEALNALHQDIDETEALPIRGDYRDALAAAAALLGESDNFNKEVYIITDRQRSQLALDAGSGKQALFDKAVRVFVLPLGDETPGNAAITEADVRSSVLEAGKPVSIRAVVSNQSESPLSDAMVSVFLNGERVTQQTVDVPAGGRSEIELNVVPKQRGLVHGMVELEDDALPEDNRRYFAFTIPENIRVLLGPSTGRDAKILSLALDPLGSTDSLARNFIIESMDRNRIAAANLSRYDVVVLTGARDLPQAFVQRLASRVRNGGSALLFPDADGNVEAFSNTLLPALGLPRPAGVQGELAASNSFTSFGRIDFDHPLFQGMFERREDGSMPEVESPRVLYSVRLRGDERAREVIGTRSGDAFVLDASVGSGKVMAFAVAADLQWSDFPFKGLFLPLINRSMYYLSSHDDLTLSMLAGETREWTLGSGATDALYELRAPDGSVQRIAPKSLPSGLVFPIEAPRHTGVYTLNAGDRVLTGIVVNSDAREADLEHGSADDLAAYLAHFGIANATVLARDVSVQQAITEVRFGVELWKYMLMLAIVCALIEMIVARDSKRALLPQESA